MLERFFVSRVVPVVVPLGPVLGDSLGLSNKSLKVSVGRSAVFLFSAIGRYAATKEANLL